MTREYVEFNAAYGKPSRRPVLNKGDPGWRETFESIPIISFKNIDGSLNERKALAAEVYKAFSEVGFLQASECPGITKELLENTFATLREFFALPMQEKMTADWNQTPGSLGYESFAQARGNQPNAEAAKLDMREGFAFGDDFSEPEQHYQGKIPEGAKAQNVWPANFPKLRADLYEYYDRVYPLARSLLQICALALDLPETAFESTYKWPIRSVRAHHYTPQPPSQDVPSLAAHADFASLTLVCQEPGSAPCLQVLNLNGHWIYAPPSPEVDFTINVGDLLEHQTNGKFVSTIHRVFNKTGAERFSLPFFITPDPDTLLQPLPGCVGEQGPLYDPLLVGDHQVKRIFQSRRAHPTAKYLAEHNIPESEWTFDLIRNGLTPVAP